MPKMAGQSNVSHVLPEIDKEVWHAFGIKEKGREPEFKPPKAKKAGLRSDADVLDLLRAIKGGKPIRKAAEEMGFSYGSAIDYWTGATRGYLIQMLDEGYRTPKVYRRRRK